MLFVLCGWVNPHREQQTIPQGQTSSPLKSLHTHTAASMNRDRRKSLLYTDTTPVLPLTLTLDILHRSARRRHSPTLSLSNDRIALCYSIYRSRVDPIYLYIYICIYTYTYIYIFTPPVLSLTLIPRTSSYSFARKKY